LQRKIRGAKVAHHEEFYRYFAIGWKQPPVIANAFEMSVAAISTATKARLLSATGQQGAHPMRACRTLVEGIARAQIFVDRLFP
jgi:hypothetical protein